MDANHKLFFIIGKIFLNFRYNFLLITSFCKNSWIVMDYGGLFPLLGGILSIENGSFRVLLEDYVYKVMEVVSSTYIELSVKPQFTKNIRSDSVVEGFRNVMYETKVLDKVDRSFNVI